MLDLRHDLLRRRLLLPQLSTTGDEQGCGEDEEASAIAEGVFDGSDAEEDGESDEARLRRWASDVFKHRDKLTLHQGAYYAALVEDTDRKILLKPLPITEALPILQAHACQHVLAATGDAVDPGLGRKLVEYWRHYAESLEWPDAMALPAEDIWCLHLPMPPIAAHLGGDGACCSASLP